MTAWPIEAYAAVLTALVLFSATDSRADGTGFYGQLTGQALSVEKIGHGGSGGLGGLPGLVITTDYDLGFGALGSLGYDFPGGFRAELEGGYRKSNIDQVVLSSDGGLGVALGLGSLDGLTLQGGGDARVLSGMANLYYDHDLGGGLAPYVMAGGGFARVATTLQVFGTTLIDDHDVVPAWQLGVGAGYALTDSVTLSGGYRYFAAAETQIRDAAGNAINGEYVSHNFELGIRVSF